MSRYAGINMHSLNDATRVRGSRERRDIAESRGEEGEALERRVSVKEARRRGEAREAARGKTLSPARFS